MKKIGIIDYGMGNLGSVSNACRYLGWTSEILTGPDGMDACSAVILPGVGSFGDCMAHLKDHGFIGPLQDWIRADRPFLGICLGLQVLFEGSDESPDYDGLGMLPGVIPRFVHSRDHKVPQIGWNRVMQRQPDCPLFEGIPDGAYFYFVHSYYAPTPEADFAAGISEYGLSYASLIWQRRMMAVQFHPEKSQRTGLRLLSNFKTWLDQQPMEQTA